MAEAVSALVVACASFVVTGGTGSGKTTLLSGLLGLVPRSERIVLVEDSAELMPDHPHVVRLESRAPNVENAGAVTLSDLVRQALRMRPDRLVVGEVRGPEVVDLLAAMNTGHEGGCGTLHANEPADVPARFEALGVAAGLDRAAVHSQLAAGVDAVVHLRRGGDGIRRVTEIGVVQGDGSGSVLVVPALTLQGRARGYDVLDRLLRRAPDQRVP
jgi:pilus assembly protein CpaF